MVIDDIKTKQHFWEGKGESGGSGGIETDHIWRQCAGEMLLYVLPHQIHIQLKTVQGCSVWGVMTTSIDGT